MFRITNTYPRVPSSFCNNCTCNLTHLITPHFLFSFFTRAAKTLSEFGYTILSKFYRPHEVSIARPRVIHFIRRNRELDTESINKSVSGTSESSKSFLQLKQVQRNIVETFTQNAKRQLEQSEQYTEQLNAYRKKFDELFEAEKGKKRKG